MLSTAFFFFLKMEDNSISLLQMDDSEAESLSNFVKKKIVIHV